MVMAVRKYFLLWIFVALSGCGQVSVSSYSELANTKGNTALLEEIQTKVESLVTQQYEGSCYTPNWGDHLYFCSTSDLMRISTGFDPESGNIFIDLDSDVGFIFPTSKASIKAGKFLTPEHREWENWINTEFADYDFVEKTRHTNGEIVQEF